MTLANATRMCNELPCDPRLCRGWTQDSPIGTWGVVPCVGVSIGARGMAQKSHGCRIGVVHSRCVISPVALQPSHYPMGKRRQSSYTPGCGTHYSVYGSSESKAQQQLSRRGGSTGTESAANSDNIDRGGEPLPPNAKISGKEPSVRNASPPAIGGYCYCSPSRAVLRCALSRPS